MPSHARGFALLAVTLSLFVLALIAAFVMRSTVQDAKLNRALELQTRAEYAAMSAVELAVYDALATPVITPTGTVKNYTIGDTVAVVRMSDESGRIDINEANEATLSAVFAALGAPATEAGRFAAAIADWRDIDDTTTTDGAEAADYQALNLTYGPRNAPFETLGELRQLRGMTDQMFACVSPVVTIYGDSSTVNFNVAPQEVLNIYDWAQTNNWLGEDWTVPTPDPMDQGEIQVVRSDGSGAVLRMEILLTMSNNQLFIYKAFVRLTRTQQLPYELLAFTSSTVNQGLAPCWP